MEDLVRKRLLERPRDHVRYLSSSAVDSNPMPLGEWQTGYLHFFCWNSFVTYLARITTITQYVTSFGILGNWMVINCSETILTAAGSFSTFPMAAVVPTIMFKFSVYITVLMSKEKMEAVRRERGRVIEEKINHYKIWAYVVGSPYCSRLHTNGPVSTGSSE